MKFDRILCDVPCSGDGTLRKNPVCVQKINYFEFYPKINLFIYRTFGKSGIWGTH